MKRPSLVNMKKLGLFPAVPTGGVSASFAQIDARMSSRLTPNILRMTAKAAGQYSFPTYVPTPAGVFMSPSAFPQMSLPPRDVNLTKL